MKSQNVASKRGLIITATIVFVLSVSELSNAQAPSGRLQAPANQAQTNDRAEGEPALEIQQQAEQELRNGTDLTRRGLFKEAIPHLLVAHGRVSNEYAAAFNLALCYVGTNQFERAIDLLKGLLNGAHAADVENLLAQAYIGNGQPQEALTALQKAAVLTPQNEKLYLLVADACTDHHDYALGLKVADLGLRNLSQSPRLHYERGVFLSRLDDFDHAKADFELVSKVAPGSEISYLASAHEALLDGNIAEAIRVAREGVGKSFDNPVLLTILGEALIRSGASPGQPEFAEAEAVLRKSVAKQPNDASARLCLGELYLVEGHLDDAIAQLQRAQQIDPSTPAVYASLAKAYQRRGDLRRAQEALEVLTQLNQAQADRISSAPGDRKVSYGGRVADDEPSH